MKNKINVAVIGVGNMGKNHVRIYYKNPKVNLVAICDKNEKLGTFFAKKYRCKFYKDYKKILENEDLDAVSIVVPNILHKEMACYFLENKINVLLEKPIAQVVEDGKKILETADRSKAVLLVGHIERHNPAVIKTKAIIYSGKIGKVTNIIVRRVGGLPTDKTQSDVAIDLAVHDIDIVNMIYGKLPENIYVYKKAHKYEKVSDTVEIFINYNNASAFVQANWTTPVKIRKMAITGTEGYLELDYVNQEIILYKSTPESFVKSTEDFSKYLKKFSKPKKKKIKIKKEEPLKNEIDYFLKSIRKNKKENQKYALDSLKIALNKF